MNQAAKLPYGLFAMWPVRFPLSAAVLQSRDLAGIYIQFGWNVINPAPGRFDWQALDARVNEAQRAGKQVVLANRLSLWNCPEWVKQSPGVQAIALTDTNPYHKSAGQTVRVPTFWDPTYHGAKLAAIAALGQRYAGSVVGVAAAFANYYTDDWAVPHQTGGGRRIDQVQQWRAAGYSTERMLGVGQQIVEGTAAAFPGVALKMPIAQTDARLDGTPTRLAELIVAWCRRHYPETFCPQWSRLSTQTGQQRDAILDILMNQRQCGMQMLAAASNGAVDRCRQNGGNAPCQPAAVLQNSLQAAVPFRPYFIEMWWQDCVNPALAAVLHEGAAGFA